jgi:uncharacterized SAM-binding protein YcdF (DUF218 family)
LLGAIWLFRASLLTAAGNALVENDSPQKAQAVVVLGGDDYGTRTLKAAELVRAGYAPYAIVSGPPSLLEPESDRNIEFARRKGYPVSLFRSVPNDSDSTRSEAAFLSKYLQRQGIHKILLVTSNFHTRRAAHLVRMQDARLLVIVVPASDRYFTPDGWWKSRSGLKTFFLETSKTIATWFGI